MLTFIPDFMKSFFSGAMVQWLSSLHNFIQSLKSGSAQAQILGDSRWCGSLTMVPTGSKDKRYSPVNHAAKTIHHDLFKVAKVTSKQRPNLILISE